MATRTAAQKSSQTTNLGVRGSNPFGRAINSLKSLSDLKSAENHRWSIFAFEVTSQVTFDCPKGGSHESVNLRFQRKGAPSALA